MLIKVTHEDVAIEEADDLRRLNVQSHVNADSTFERLDQSGLASATLQPDWDVDGPPAVWLSILALRRRAHDSLGAPTEEWEQSWSNMISFADQHGWVRDESYVRAHIETSSLDGTGEKKGPETTS